MDASVFVLYRHVWNQLIGCTKMEERAWCWPGWDPNRPSELTCSRQPLFPWFAPNGPQLLIYWLIRSVYKVGVLVASVRIHQCWTDCKIYRRCLKRAMFCSNFKTEFWAKWRWEHRVSTFCDKPDRHLSHRTWPSNAAIVCRRWWRTVDIAFDIQADARTHLRAVDSLGFWCTLPGYIISVAASARKSERRVISRSIALSAEGGLIGSVLFKKAPPPPVSNQLATVLKSMAVPLLLEHDRYAGVLGTSSDVHRVRFALDISIQHGAITRANLSSAQPPRLAGTSSISTLLTVNKSCPAWRSPEQY